MRNNIDGFNKELQCFWDKWEFNGPTCLSLHLPSGNCTDMGGCIRTAKKLMPEVGLISVYEGGVHINTYARVNKSWICKK